jgi:hypothetical protein
MFKRPPGGLRIGYRDGHFKFVSVMTNQPPQTVSRHGITEMGHKDALFFLKKTSGPTIIMTDTDEAQADKYLLLVRCMPATSLPVALSKTADTEGITNRPGSGNHQAPARGAIRGFLMKR